MMGNKKNICIIIFIFSLFIFSFGFIAASGVGGSTYSISGYVFDNFGTGLGDVKVVQVENISNTAITSTSGYYLITGLPNGTHNFIYSKEGFETGNLEVSINDADNNSANIRIFDLTPPGQVSGLGNDTPTQTSVNISWNSLTDANYYQVFRNSSSLGFTKNTFWSDTGLNPSTLYRYWVSANDSYNNWGADSDVLSIVTSAVPDTTPPTVTITSPSSNSILNISTVAVSGTASDTGSGVQKVEVSVDGNAFAPAIGTTSWSFTTSTLSDGTHTITAKATDNAGNTAETSITVISDTTPPVVAITYPADGQIFNTSSITVSGTASDARLDKVEVKVGTGAWQTASGTSWSLQVTLEEGLNIISARATDTAGNTKEASINVISDTASPTVIISSPSNNSILNTATIAVSGTASDAGSGVQKVWVSVDGGAFATVTGTASWSYTTSALSDGTHTITARATDNAGNAKETSIKVISDTTPPAITITSPADGGIFNTSSITVSGTASDAIGLGKVEVKVGNGAWQTASGTTSWSLQVTLSEGSNTIFARATDTAGNTKEASINVISDTTPPAITITSPTNGAVFTTSSITINGTASDARLDKVEVKVGNGAWQTASGTTSWSLQVTLSEGSNTIFARTTDTAGNTKEASINVISDTVSPTVIISSPSNNSVLNTATIAVSGTASDAGSGVQKVWVSVDGGAFATVTGTASWSYTTSALSDGTHTITARATDNAGNAKETSIKVISDTTPPAITITSPADGGIFNTSSIIVSGTAYDAIGLNNVEVKVGNKDWQSVSGTTSWTIQVTLEEGSNMISARATDTAGNTNESSINVTLDTTPPASVTSPMTYTEVGRFFINNSWVNPIDPDLSTIWFRYSNGTTLQNVSAPVNYLNLSWPPYYIQEISAQTVDSYGNINRTKVWFNATIPDPLKYSIRFIEPGTTNDGNETWLDAQFGHVGKFIGVDGTFMNKGLYPLDLKITEYYNNELSSWMNISSLAPDENRSYKQVFGRPAFEINSSGVRDDLFNFTFEINITVNASEGVYTSYKNITTISLPMIPIFKIKRANGDIAIVGDGFTDITYTLEANSSVNLTNISIYDPYYPQNYFNISKLEVNNSENICWNNGIIVPCQQNYHYQATTNDLSSNKCEEGYPCIINLATFTAKWNDMTISDTDYVEILVCKEGDNGCPLGVPSKRKSIDSGGTSGINNGNSNSISGGGGGGGALGSGEDFNNIESREVREMNTLAFAPTAYVFRSSEPVMVVSFVSSVTANDIPVVVEVLKNRSKFIDTEAPGNLYKYFNVNVGSFRTKIGNGVVVYRVNNSWFDENNLEPKDVSLYKWIDGMWVEKNTQIVESKPNYTYFASLVGNFSSFAIVGKRSDEFSTTGGIAINALPSEESLINPISEKSTAPLQKSANMTSFKLPFNLQNIPIIFAFIFGMGLVLIAVAYRHKNNTNNLKIFGYFNNLISKTRLDRLWYDDRKKLFSWITSTLSVVKVKPLLKPGEFNLVKVGLLIVSILIIVSFFKYVPVERLIPAGLNHWIFIIVLAIGQILVALFYFKNKNININDSFKLRGIHSNLINKTNSITSSTLSAVQRSYKDLNILIKTVSSKSVKSLSSASVGFIDLRNNIKIDSNRLIKTGLLIVPVAIIALIVHFGLLPFDPIKLPIVFILIFGIGQLLVLIIYYALVFKKDMNEYAGQLMEINKITKSNYNRYKHININKIKKFKEES